MIPIGNQCTRNQSLPRQSVVDRLDFWIVNSLNPALTKEDSTLWESFTLFIDLRIGVSCP